MTVMTTLYVPAVVGMQIIPAPRLNEPLPHFPAVWMLNPGGVVEPGAPAHHGGDGNGRRPPKMVSTSADELEEAFMRRKRRELEQARMAGAGDAQPVQQVVRSQEKVGRNDPCPCGSGKKYKKCHGA